MQGNGLNENIDRDFVGGSPLKQPNFPSDIMEKLWDDYYDVRDRSVQQQKDESLSVLKNIGTQYSP